MLFRDWSQCYDQSKFNVQFCGIKSSDPGSVMLEEMGQTVFYLNENKYSPLIINKLIDLVKKEDIDLLHLHGYSSANFGRIASQRVNIPNVVHEHAILKVQPHQYMADYVLRHQTDRAIAVAGAVKDFLIQGRHVPAEKIDVIYNSVDVNRFGKVSKNAIKQFRQHFNVPEKYHVIGNLTRLRKEKGNEYLIDAMPFVLEKEPDTVCLIFGDGPLMDSLKNKVHDMQLDHNVRFTGFVDDIPTAFASIDLKVIPSLTEGCPFALIEAMASEKPVVATRVGGMKEVVKDNETGILVEPQSPKALADGIVRILSDSKLAKQMGKRAKNESKAYHVDQIVRAHENIYTSLLDG